MKITETMNPAYVLRISESAATANLQPLCFGLMLSTQRG